MISSHKIDMERDRSNELSQRLDEMQTKLSQSKLEYKDIQVSPSKDGPRITSAPPDKTFQTQIDACNGLLSEDSDVRAQLHVSRSENEKLKRLVIYPLIFFTSTLNFEVYKC